MTTEQLANVKKYIREAHVNLNMASYAFSTGKGFSEEEISLFDDLQTVISDTGRLFLSHYDVLK